MKSLKENAYEIILCVFELFVGILLLINPMGFTKGIIVTFGIALCILGLVNAVKYFKTPPHQAATGQRLFFAMIFFIMGMLFVLEYNKITTLIYVLTFIYGIVILVAGLSKIQWTVDLIRLKRKNFYFPAISAAISIICAMIILINPFTTTKILWIFIGVALILDAVVDAVSLGASGKIKIDSKEE